MSFLEFATLLAAIAGVLVSLSVIWQKGVKPVFQFFSHIKEIHDIVQELKPNGGGSIKDQVKATHDMIEAHINDPRLHRPSMDGLSGRIESEPTKEE